MSNNIDITLTADSKAAQQSFDKMQAEVDKLSRQLEKMRDKGKRAADDNKRGMDQVSTATLKATQSVVGMVTTYVSLGTAVKAAISEVEKLNRLQEQSRQAHVNPAQRIRDAKNAFEPDATMGRADFEPALRELAAKTGLTIEDVVALWDRASSAKGTFTNLDVKSAVLESAKVNAKNIEQGAVMASRNLGIAQAGGFRDMRIATGFQQNLGIASHGMNMQAIGQHLVPTINQMAAFGDTQEQAGEIGSALSQILQDEELRLSSTAMIQIGEQLHQFRLKRAEKGKFKGQLMAKDFEGEFAVPDAQHEALMNATNTQDRMAVMRSSPELFRAFSATFSGDAKTKQASLALVRGEEKSLAQLRAAQESVRGTQTPEDRAFQIRMNQEQLNFLNSGPSAILAKADQGVTSALEQARLENERGARMASARAAFSRVLADTDLPGMDPEWLYKFELWKSEANQSLERAMGRDVGAPEDPALHQMRILRRHFQKVGRVADVERLNDVIQQVDSQRQAFDGATPPPTARQTHAQGVDPQMDEQNKILKEMNTSIGGLLKAVQQQNAPRQTERPASRLSRITRLSQRGEK